MDPLSLGMTAASVGSGLYSLFGGGSNQPNYQAQAAQFALQQQDMNLAMVQNAQRQKQMNLDANRRKRDIIRQAQVATANAEAAAAGSGALNSSGVEGARATISGQAGVNYLGVSQNQEIGNTMFALDNMRAQNQFQQSQLQAMQQSRTPRTDYGSAVGSFFNADNRNSINSVYTYLRSL